MRNTIYYIDDNECDFNTVADIIDRVERLTGIAPGSLSNGYQAQSVAGVLTSHGQMLRACQDPKGLVLLDTLLDPFFEGGANPDWQSERDKTFDAIKGQLCKSKSSVQAQTALKTFNRIVNQQGWGGLPDQQKIAALLLCVCDAWRTPCVSVSTAALWPASPRAIEEVFAQAIQGSRLVLAEKTPEKIASKVPKLLGLDSALSLFLYPPDPPETLWFNRIHGRHTLGWDDVIRDLDFRLPLKNATWGADELTVKSMFCTQVTDGELTFQNRAIKTDQILSVAQMDTVLRAGATYEASRLDDSRLPGVFQKPIAAASDFEPTHVHFHYRPAFPLLFAAGRLMLKLFKESVDPIGPTLLAEQQAGDYLTCGIRQRHDPIELVDMLKKVLPPPGLAGPFTGEVAALFYDALRGTCRDARGFGGDIPRLLQAGLSEHAWYGSVEGRRLNSGDTFMIGIRWPVRFP